jgi:hypothetical protein
MKTILAVFWIVFAVLVIHFATGAGVPNLGGPSCVASDGGSCD